MRDKIVSEKAFYSRFPKNASYLGGQRFGRLMALRPDGRQGGNIKWLCICDCGEYTSVVNSSLTRGQTRSCNCLQKDRMTEIKTTHGMADSGEYKTWQHMLDRCTNPNNKDFHHYGGRGISVCDRWLDFENFYEDMGDRPSGLELDRIDNDGDYETGNCRWATRKQQTRNTRRNRVIEVKGVRACISEWAEAFGIDQVTLRHRIVEKGWSTRRALTEVHN